MSNVKVCFFSSEGLESINRQQYSIQDIKILKELNFDVIIASKFSQIPLDCDLYFSWWASGSFFPLIIAKILKKPIIVIVGGNEAMHYRDSKSNLSQGYLSYPIFKRLLIKYTLRNADELIVVSKFMLRSVKLLSKRTPLVIPNSVDTYLFSSITNVKREFITSVFNLQSNPFLLKRGEIFIRSIPRILEHYPEVVFMIIGKIGDQFDFVTNLIHSLGIENNVILMGPVDNSEIVNLYQKSIIYVQLSDTETFGLSVAEAMSCETPVVVSKMGALPELVGDIGIFVDHNDLTSVSNQILNILNMTSDERKRYGKQLRNRILSFYDYKIRKEALSKICLKYIK